jgi:hypothetical protein
VLQWNAPWLAANWQHVVQALMAGRQMQLAGLIGPAKPAGFADGVLTLAFDPQHELLRSRCASQMDGAIAAALSALAGRPITCRYQTTASGDKPAPTGPVFGGLSTAEKNAVGKDPSVRAVIDLFGGEVVDIRRDAAAPAPPETEES